MPDAPGRMLRDCRLLEFRGDRQAGRPCAQGVHAKIAGDLQVEDANEEGAFGLKDQTAVMSAAVAIESVLREAGPPFPRGVPAFSFELTENHKKKVENLME